jgi:two-component system NtrC family sensor kinase
MPRDDSRRSPTPLSTTGEARARASSDTRELGDAAAARASDASISVEAGSGGRATITELPSPWLDQMFLLSLELPIRDGAEAVVRAVLALLASIAPSHRAGVRMPLVFGPAHRVVFADPPASREHSRRDRLFPDSAFERQVALPAPLGTGSLHVASDDPTLEDDRSPIAQLVYRASLVVSDGLVRVQAHEQRLVVERELLVLKAHMVQAEKLASLGQIAAGMVHELNNPLTSIVAYTDYLLRRAERAAHGEPVTSDAEDVERLRRIAESANRMLRFTRDLVSYARPSSELPVPVQLHAVINRALAFCEHELAAVGAKVERDFDGSVGSVCGMPEQLAQVFVNLVTNACHAMAQGSPAPGATDGAPPPEEPSREDTQAATLTISTSLVDGGKRVEVIVSDTGHGIAPPHLPLVFAPFFTTKGSGRGTGLGLSIVKNIVDSHRGAIRVESEPPLGSRFILLFPVDSATDRGQ